MEWNLLWRGALIGFAIAAPVGPIGVLTIRRTLAGGWAAGFATGMGAASADAIYGAVAAFGLTAISALLISVQGALQIAGGLFLCWLGYRAFFAAPAAQGTAPGRLGVLRAYGSTVLLTLANPATILSFLAVFAGLGFAGAAATEDSAAMLVLGVFAGSAAWWLILATAIARVRHAIAPPAMRWINRASGVLLGGFGVWALTRLI